MWISYHPKLSRRAFTWGAASGLVGMLASTLTGQVANKLTVGFIYVGPRDDFGYNQAHAQGAAAVATLPGVTMVEEENVQETFAVQKSMESLRYLKNSST